MFTDLALGLILIDVLSNIAHWMLVSVSVLGFFVMLFTIAAEGFDVGSYVQPVLKKYLIFAGISMVIVASIPSKQTMYLALGLRTTGAVAEQIAESEVGKKALNVLEVKLDEILANAPTKSEEESK